jgi:hypothetical protein
MFLYFFFLIFKWVGLVFYFILLLTMERYDLAFKKKKARAVYFHIHKEQVLRKEPYFLNTVNSVTSE